MDRRDFLKHGMLSLALFLPGLPGWAYGTGDDSGKSHRLIVIMLRGAVDGLNVVVPYGDDHYYQIRHSIAVGRPNTEHGVLDLDGYFGLHPALAPLMPFWQSRQLAMVHASGSPDPTRSHFDAQDYMESGLPGSKTVSTGWMNRLLAEMPNNRSPIRGLNFGETMPRIFSGPQSVGMAPEVLAKAHPMNSAVEHAFTDMYGGRQDALGNAFREGIEAKHQINDDLADDIIMKGSQGAPTPGKFANFGSKIAQLMRKDPSVKIAFLAFGGWDTHVNEGAGQGQLANHLGPLGRGLAELAQGLGSDFKNTTIIVMSEFGRTARENGNGGTDHGHGNVMWLLGGNVAGGKVYGRWSSLADRDLHENRDVPVTTDFRTVLASVLGEHLEVSRNGLQRVFPDFSTTGHDLPVLV